ncbi:hypothetical protein F5887DRAFT_1076367 [Amanita rubescens]|nr:hypothetical protein F5887DRAFT_1076367 [Amanita rubescens]
MDKQTAGYKMLVIHRDEKGPPSYRDPPSMRQNSAIQQSDAGTPPESSDEECTDDSFIVKQLSFVIERLAILESRLDRLERASVRNAAQVPNLAPSPRPNHAAETHTAQVTPRKTKTTRGIQLGVNPRSPAHCASPHQVHVRSGESQGSYHAPGMTKARLPSEDEGFDGVAGPSQQRSRLPDHYFHPNPISSPDWLSQSLERTQDDTYFVITQGLEPGIYAGWPETAVLAKNVNGVWKKAYSRKAALEIYRKAYDSGFCKRIHHN